MNENGMIFTIGQKKISIDELDELIGDQHVYNSDDTPLRKDAFAISEEEKIKLITDHFRAIMNVLGMDLDDESLKGTPRRVANMFIKELFSGLDPKNKPGITLFENKYRYNQLVVEKNITLYSTCEHHFVPIIGKAHIAYISSGKVIGLSKLNRLVQYYSQRPQVQERLTMQIGGNLKSILQTEDVAVIIEATHLCVAARGVKDAGSSTTTAFYSGKFNREEIRQEFLSLIK